MNALRKPRVLCVDDEPSVLRSLNWLLQSRFEVSSATDAGEALELVGNGDFDVVISDQRMPGMTGTEFLQRVKEVSPNTMRLLLTGYSEYNDVLRSINDSEVFRFISKPWDNQHLIDTVAYAATVAREVPLPRPSNPTVTAKIDMNGLRGSRTGAVLLMDEDPAIEHQLRAVLGAEMLLLWARNPSEAVRLLHRHKVAVIVADTHADTGSTLDLIRAVKRSSPNIVAMIYTSERDGSTIGRLINEGQIFRFIAKPAAPSHVNRMIRSALKKHRDLMAQPARIARHAVEASRSLAFEHAGEATSGGDPADVAPPGAPFFDLFTDTTGTTSTASISGVTWLKRLFGKS
ncbi:response regulator [Hydrogenophaga sp.]|uniref:response regulator n=1 Tax=Hydrogenophaga sp. TaxID=1904254 RepID=UPI0025B94716|nr:response regulator [Hydrogenophaga sp.]MBT9463946.1 response regulator [Hydrogenophaga sp.]